MECNFEEDADLLFAGLSILSLGKASKKMQDQRQKLKDKRAEADIAKRYKDLYFKNKWLREASCGIK